MFFILLISGLFLFGAEIFVPGGILGTMGILCLLAAVIAGFIAFPGKGPYIALGVILLIGASFVLWITVFPRTRLGQKMTIQNDLAASKATDDELEALVGKDGKALSALRPGGFAKIEGKRVDVITSGEMISKGAALRVIDVEGNRVVVAEATLGKHVQSA